MKSKGITIWEQHIEKIVLGVAFAAFAYFAATQFIGNPNAATINGQPVPPSEIDRLLEEEAKAISAKLSPDAPPPIELPEVTPVADQMLVALEEPVSPVSSLALPGYNLVPELQGIVVDAMAFHVPEFTAPAPTLPKEYHDALTEEVVNTFADELRHRFPPGQPYDLAYATFFGEVDLAQYRAELQKSDNANDIHQIPSSWYGGKPLFVDLVIERGEVVDGELVNIVTLDPIPGQYSFRKGMEKKLSVADRNYMADQLQKPEIQSAVIQPEFLATRRGSWQPLQVGELDAVEEVDVAADEQEAELQRIDRLIRRLQQERDRISEQLKELGGPLDDTGSGRDGGTGASPGGGGGGGGGASKGPGSGSGSVSSPGPGGDDKEQTRRRRISLTRKLKQLDEQLERKQKEREEKHGAMLVEEVQDDGPLDRIMVWGHDINVEPGKTYRYRMTLKVLNPFFSRRMSLIPEQQYLAEKVTLDAQPSEWSEPITISPAVRVFLTSARGAAQSGDYVGGADNGSATFQVFRFYDGLTWSGDFVVNPGDRIGDTKRIKLTGSGGAVKEENIDFRTDWMVVDIIDKPDQSRGGALGNQRSTDARVVLMDVKSGEIVELRDPREDKSSPLRRELLDEVELSEAAAFSS